MALTPGSKLGLYEIIAPLGAGGMGEVYRAHDPTLGRDVAIKILPDTWLADPDRLARFDREARVLASLNHPHIGAIYSVDAASGVRALVLELVDGLTLDEYIKQRGIVGGSKLGVREATCRPWTLLSTLINSSAKPSLKYSFSLSELMLTKGSTATEAPGCGRAGSR